MRKSGILLPIFSLPSPYGIGTVGKAAYDFVDFLANSGQSLWQVLPLGPTSIGDSPYQSFSAMAGNPYFIDLDMLIDENLLKKEEVEGCLPENETLVDYDVLFSKRFKVLVKATARQNKTAPEYLAFCKKNEFWLNDYALFMAIKEAHGNVGFREWPKDLICRTPEALMLANAKWAPRAEFWKCLQFFFFKQWQSLKTYANAKGIQLVGDIPIYVSPDSSDLWVNPTLFEVDEKNLPKTVAGVPPDAFSDEGQLWGNPLYNWKNHKRTGYVWWLLRLNFNLQLFDVVRIDHFRGFAGYYSVPTGQTTAKGGEWKDGPGKHFIRTVRRNFPKAQIIAEDLGFLTDDVRELLAYSKYPGMKVLQFAFDSRDESDYLPHNYEKNAVVYTGTHDNTTTEDWTRSAKKEDIAFAREYFALSARQSLTDAMVRAALGSVCNTAIVPMQDWLHLGKEARINHPSTLGGINWRWRLNPLQLTDELAKDIRRKTKIYGRLSPLEKAKDRKANLPITEQVLNIAAIRKAEENAVLNGTSLWQLMQNAGGLSAKRLQKLENNNPSSALILCGKGNNTGDALVMANDLAKAGWDITCLMLIDGEMSQLAKKAENTLLPSIKTINMQNMPENFDSYCYVVDAVFGIGFKGALSDDISKIFEIANSSKATRIALDMPSGLNADTCLTDRNTFKAQHTFSFGSLKPALVSPSCKAYYGSVHVLDIGL